VATEIERVIRKRVTHITVNLSQWRGDALLTQWTNVPRIEHNKVVGVDCFGRIIKDRREYGTPRAERESKQLIQ